MSNEPYVSVECPTCKGDGAVYEQVRVRQFATPFVCKQCDGEGEVIAVPPTPTTAEVKRIFSAHALKSDRKRLSVEFDRFIQKIRAEALREYLSAMKDNEFAEHWDKEDFVTDIEDWTSSRIEGKGYDET